MVERRADDLTNRGTGLAARAGVGLNTGTRCSAEKHTISCKMMYNKCGCSVPYKNLGSAEGKYVEEWSGWDDRVCS